MSSIKCECGKSVIYGEYCECGKLPTHSSGKLETGFADDETLQRMLEMEKENESLKSEIERLRNEKEEILAELKRREVELLGIERGAGFVRFEIIEEIFSKFGVTNERD